MMSRLVTILIGLFVYLVSWGGNASFDTVRNFSKEFGPWQACQLMLGSALTSPVRARFLSDETSDYDRQNLFNEMSSVAHVTLLAELVVPQSRALDEKFILTWMGHLMQVIKPSDPLEREVVLKATQHVLDVVNGNAPHSGYPSFIPIQLRVYAAKILEYLVQFESMSDEQYELLQPSLSEVLFGSEFTTAGPDLVKDAVIDLLQAITRDTNAIKEVHQWAFAFLDRYEGQVRLVE